MQVAHWWIQCFWMDMEWYSIWTQRPSRTSNYASSIVCFTIFSSMHLNASVDFIWRVTANWGNFIHRFPKIGCLWSKKGRSPGITEENKHICFVSLTDGQWSSWVKSLNWLGFSSNNLLPFSLIYSLMLFCSSSTKDNNLTLTDLHEWVTWSPELISFTLLTSRTSFTLTG